MKQSKCFAIGDIHGHCKALSALLAILKHEAGMTDQDLLVFLGDYVDRGPDDEGVLAIVKNLENNRPNTVALLGNHDSWRTSGTIDPAYALWLRGLPKYFRWKSYFFSHAPVYCLPNAEALDRLPRELWGGIRSFDDAVRFNYDFLNSYAGFAAKDLLRESGVTGVCGHVHHDRVVIYPDHYIGVDSGCGFGGELSAVELPSLKIWDVESV